MSKDQSVDRGIVLSDEEKRQLAEKGFLVVCDQRNNAPEDEDRYQTNVTLLVHPMSPLHPEFRVRFQEYLSDLCETVDTKYFQSDGDTPEDHLRRNLNPPD